MSNVFLNAATRNPYQVYHLSGNQRRLHNFTDTPDLVFPGWLPQQAEATANHFSASRAGLHFIEGAVVNPLKSLFSMKGLLVTAAATALTVATGGLAAPVLLGLGLVNAGYQTFKGGLKLASGLLNGNVRQAENAFEDLGSGVSTGLLSAFGLRKFYQNGPVVTTYTPKGATTSTLSTEAAQEGLFASLKHLYRDVTMQTQVQGTELNLWQAAGRNFNASLDSLKSGAVWAAVKNNKAILSLGNAKTHALEKFKALANRITGKPGAPVDAGAMPLIAEPASVSDRVAYPATILQTVLAKAEGYKTAASAWLGNLLKTRQEASPSTAVTP